MTVRTPEPDHNVTVAHFYPVKPFLYRSAQPRLHEYEQLPALKVRTIFNLREELLGTSQLQEIERETARLGIQHIHIPLCFTQPPSVRLSEYLGTINAARKSGEAVLVHCAHGMDRTGFMIGAYRILVEDWDFDRTFREMLSYGFHAILLEFVDTLRAMAGESAKLRSL